MARRPFTVEEAVDELRHHASGENRAGMARFGINVSSALGVPVTRIRAVGRKIEPSHQLALGLWESGVHEARILASIVERPAWTDRAQMDRWAADFNSWDLCDQTCLNLFENCAPAEACIRDWSDDEREFVRRAAFALMACRAVRRKTEPDETFLAYLPIIEKHAADPRNFVRKAVNWALRQIGKRSRELNNASLVLARRLAGSKDKTERWIGKNAVRELASASIQQRMTQGAGR
jgi:3-methyladenine DNA glycosylase AlkD